MQMSAIVNWLKRFVEPITVVTILLFVATWALYGATRNLVDDARVDSQIKLRAYVGMTELILPQWFDPPGDTGNYLIYTRIRNSGQTNTLKMSVQTNCAPDRLFVFKDSPHYTLQPRKVYISLSAGSDVKLPICNSPSKNLKTVQTLDVWGRIVYTDVFSHQHLSEFAWRISQFSGSPSDRNFGASDVAPSGVENNCSDDECPSWRDKETFNTGPE